MFLEANSAHMIVKMKGATSIGINYRQNYDKYPTNKNSTAD